MGLDSLTKRYQVALFTGLVGVAAYFQASGIGQLVAGHLVPTAAVKPAAHKAAEEAKVSTKSGNPILARNAFDSVTGPLIGVTPVGATTEKPVVNKPSGDPYLDTACTGIRSSLITAANDSAWSFASLSSPEGEKLRRIGDKVGVYTVTHIGYYESPNQEVTPRVWLTDPSHRCMVAVGAAEVGVAKPVAGEPPKPTRPKNSKRAELEAKVKSKITKLGENSYEVDKSGVELIIQHYTKLAGSLRGKPTKAGMKLAGIRDGSILKELGMDNGDMLKNINGFDMSDPDKAVDAYAKLRRAGQLDISVNREGKPFTVNVKIR